VNKRTLLEWILLAAMAIAILLVPIPIWSPSPQDHVVRIEAKSYEFHPGIIRVNPGDRVNIELVSTDVVHGIYIDGYGLELEADPGKTASLTFQADRPGTYRFRCSVTCGPLHPFMIGKIQVGPNPLLWRGIGLAFLALLAGVWSIRR
jgi:heme/copper-type cytochrome/quinol oxidase subunit 2